MPLPLMTAHRHPDGTVIATATLADGRVLRVAGCRDDQDDTAPYDELSKALQFQELQRVSVVVRRSW